MQVVEEWEAGLGLPVNLMEYLTSLGWPPLALRGNKKCTLIFLKPLLFDLDM